MNNKGTTLLIVILSILVIVAGGMLIYKIINEKEESENVVADDNVDINEDKDDKELVVEEKKPQIFNGNDRPIAVMIDNHSGAWPQANLNKAYLVYEIIVEGGETRLMAVFKGQDLEKIGPIRSSRHYFLDYALENDAIYVHHGWSPQAQNDISALNVNNINGIQESSNNFWRVKDKKSPHNMFTSTTSILKIAERKGYATISDKKSVLNYIASDVDLKEKYGIAEEQTENTSAESKAINATKIVIPHSTLQTVEYDYDENSKTYVRYARGKVQTDYITGENIQTKNIIITMCDNYTLADSEEKDLVFLDIEMPGMNGIYIGNELKKANKNVIIFVVTSYSEYLDDAMRFHVFRYLSKPLDRSRFLRNMKDALTYYNSITVKIPVETRQGLYSFPASQIIAIEAQSRKVIVHTVQQDFDSIYTMDYWLNLLPKNSFFQTHRSFIINLDHVVDFDHFTIHLSNPQLTAYLTRRKYSSFKNAYLLYLESMR